VLFHSTIVNTPWVIALGELRRASWLWYFPLAFAIKNPLPLLIALLFAGGGLLGRRQNWVKLRVLGSFSILYAIIAIARGPNLGYRHMIPIHPLLYLLIAGGIEQAARSDNKSDLLPRLGRWAIAALGVWYITGTLWIYPHELAFFNEAVGGPSNGWRYLEGSNTDWGQAWKALRTFREERELTFSYSGTEGYAGVAPYDLWDEPLPPLHLVSEPLFKPWLFPEPGDYVIAANTLTGFFLVNRDNFAWFRYHEPDDVIGHVLYYYHVDSTQAPTWLAQCNHPDAPAPLDEKAIAEGFGAIDLHTITFDCTSSWIYPGGGATRGMYTLHSAGLQPETLSERLYLAPARPMDAFAARHLEDVPLAYRQWEYQMLPSFVLYEWEGTTAPYPTSPKARVAHVSTPPTGLTSERLRTAPLPLDGLLTFLGTTTSFQADALEMETWWQVTEGPITQPLSIMAHLLAEDGTVLGTADGFGISPLVLTPGDVVVQRHRFAKPTEGVEVWLRTGVYWLATQERWPVNGVEGDNALFVSLESGQHE
jgi:hypothetical protein